MRLTYAELVHEVERVARLLLAMGLRKGDRVCIPVPFYHCFGMVLGNLACTTHGAAIVVPAPAFDPMATLHTVESERCTSLYGVPTMFIAELDHPDFDDYDLTSLRTGIMAGSPCPVEVIQGPAARRRRRQERRRRVVRPTRRLPARTTVSGPRPH